jgi:hypothetical protein
MTTRMQRIIKHHRAAKGTAQQAARPIKADTTEMRLGDELLLQSAVKDYTMMKKRMEQAKRLVGDQKVAATGCQSLTGNCY